MKLIVLNDELPGECPAEHGLSFLIEDANDGNEKILFDVGPSEIFLKNAERLRETLDDVACIVLSHGHYDHGNGLKFIKGKKLVCHPNCFVKRYRKRDDSYVGLPLTLTQAEKQFELVLAKKPLAVSKNVFFLGEVPRENGFEAKNTGWYCLKGREKKDDFVLDDSALAVKTRKGLVVVAGCSHSGICNIVEYAKKVTEKNKVYAVIGGFHLLELSDAAKKTAEYFEKQKVERVIPSHCVSEKVIRRFAETLPVERIHSGDSLNL